jgi:hypothetical protein
MNRFAKIPTQQRADFFARSEERRSPRCRRNPEPGLSQFQFLQPEWPDVYEAAAKDADSTPRHDIVAAASPPSVPFSNRRPF